MGYTEDCSGRDIKSELSLRAGREVMFSWVILTLDQVRKLSQCIVLTDKKMY